MLNIAYTHASVVLVTFHYYMLQNKQSNRYSYGMTSVVVLFVCTVKLNISTRKGVKLYQRNCTVILTDLSNAIKKMLVKISFHKHFNSSNFYNKKTQTKVYYL